MLVFSLQLNIPFDWFIVSYMIGALLFELVLEQALASDATTLLFPLVFVNFPTGTFLFSVFEIFLGQYCSELIQAKAINLM